jgi:hypothetical protein
MTIFANQAQSYVFNISDYANNASTWRGEFQRDLLKAEVSYPELQSSTPVFNQLRSPYEEPWSEVNTVFPVYNNLINCFERGGAVSKCLANQTRYKNNFMCVKNLHLFSSPNDFMQAPYQTGLYGAYSTVDSYDAIANDFESLTVLDMTETREYLEDKYGLKTMHENGQIHRHLVPNVLHNCWDLDVALYNISYKWAPLYDEYIYPLLHPTGQQ